MTKIVSQKIRKHRILITPFVSLNIVGHEYLVDGILDELLFSLNQVENFVVASRSTSIYVSENPMPLQELKIRFNIDFFLEGSIVYNEGLRIKIRLYETEHENLLLNREFKTNLKEWIQPLRQMTSEVSNTICGAKMENSRVEKESFGYIQYYLRGLHHWYRYTYVEMLEAISQFKKSIRENSKFAPAYSGMSDCYTIIGLMGYDNPVEAYIKAKDAVEQSLLINDKRSETYVSAAMLNIFYDRDFEKAKTNLEQSIRLNPNNVKAQHVMAMYHIHRGELAAAYQNSAKTLELDPLAITHHAMIIRIYTYQKKYESATDHINAALSIDNQSIPIIELRGVINLLTGRIEDSIDDFKYCLNHNNENLLTRCYLANALAQAGFYGESRAIEDSIKDLVVIDNTGLSSYGMSLINLGHKDLKSFFKHVNRAVDSKLGMITGELNVHPIFDIARKDADYDKLLSKIGLKGISLNQGSEKLPIEAIRITSLTKDQLVLDPQDLICVKGNDNYCEFYWNDSGLVKSKILRTTLKQLDSTFKDYPQIYRCHKTYMVNTKAEFKMWGNSRGYFLDHPAIPFRISISRTKSNDAKKFFL